ncbi:MAG: AAA-like domain-containing protein [Cyanobacteria bacterium SBLK]|nr:AAA-like domain-containing protein [Cyanobacteria bacterium SBLK]
MNVLEPSSYKYKVGGSLEANSPTYTERQADKDFYQALITGKFCYVLNSRQTGKSSLRVRTTKRLQDENIACAVVDITLIGSHEVSPTEWYLSFLRRLTRSLRLKTTPEIQSWWNERQSSPVDRLDEFIEEVLLVEIQQKIVIFIDEIDSILKIDFKDDFFAFIRACYNNRVENINYRRLTFALLGVATPSDLIQDRKRTPFNIGQAIDLHGFQLNEVNPLMKGLEGRVESPSIVLKEILKWTSGQPFLTQKICDLVFRRSQWIAEEDTAREIEDLVRSQIIKNWEYQDEPEHLKTIRDRIVCDEQYSGRLLGLYKRILSEYKVETDESSEQIALRLAGIVVKRDGCLETYNEIYKRVFDLEWVERELAKQRPYAQAIKDWLTSNRQDRTKLLYGEKLKYTKQWKFGKTRFLSQEDNDFLHESEMFDSKSKIFLRNLKNYGIAIAEIHTWTEGLEFFDDCILQLASEALDAKIPDEDDEIDWVNNLVKQNVIDECKDEELRKHLEIVNNRMIKNPNIESFWLLCSYEKILIDGEVSNHNFSEYQELIEINLIAKKAKKLTIANKIYETIFDLQWIDEMLTLDPRPHARKFAAWLNYERDPKYLLNSQELEDALQWSDGKELDDRENDFLIDSQIFNS